MSTSPERGELVDAEKPSDELEIYFSDVVVTVFLPDGAYGWYTDLFSMLSLSPNMTVHDYTNKETRFLDHFQMKFFTATEAETYACELGPLLDSYVLVSEAVRNADRHQHEMESL